MGTLVKEQHSTDGNRPQIKGKKRRVSWLFGSVAFLLLIMAVTPVFVLFLITDSHALVEETATVKANSAVKAKEIVKTVYANLTDAEASGVSKLTLSEDEINGVIALAMRGVKNLKGRVNVTPAGINSAFSFSVPSNPFGNYINLTGIVIPSSSGLYINDISIGRFTLSGELVLSLIEKVLNLFLGGEATGTQLITSIKSIEVVGSKLIITYRPVLGLKQAIKQTKGKVKSIRNDLALLASPKDVNAYYENICTLHAKIGDLGRVPLAYYLSDTFDFAGKRTLNSNNPREENKAAILALAIFLGAAEFDSFIGAIDSSTFERCQPKDSNIVIAKRNDLRLHFIFSAVLKIMSDSSASFAIGEFKELLDSGKGGTGFSFTDLAADRSGIRFTEFALSKSGAYRLQLMASKLTKESVFFPSLRELPDGISQKNFEEKGGLDGLFYKTHLALIDRRISELPLYQ